jgi:adenylate cyclase
MHESPEFSELDRLLDRLLEHPDERGEITREVEERFGQRRAVLVLDMSGFSRTTQLYGILSFLALIHEMRRLAIPLIAEHRGHLIKAEADNLMCVFEEVADAVTASRAIVARTRGVNMDRHQGRPLYVSIGIGYGWILNIGGRDIYGSEVNLASKLGEDIGQAGRILLTDSAREALGEEGDRLHETTVRVSGVDVVYYSVDA